MAPQNPFSPLPISQKKKRGWQVAGALIAAGIVIVFVATRTPGKSPASAATAPSTAVTTKIVTLTAIPRPTSSGVSTPPTAVPAAPPSAQTTIATQVGAQPTVKLAALAAGKPVVSTKTYSGKGNGSLKVDLGGNPAVLKFTCAACSGRTTLTADGAQASLVDQVGPYSGSRLLDATSAASTGKLTISASSTWSITVADVRSVKVTKNSASGHGDTVIKMSGANAVATVANVGTSDFVVIGYGANYPQQAVHQIGTFKGTVVLTTPGYLQVESDGDWTITTAP